MKKLAAIVFFIGVGIVCAQTLTELKVDPSRQQRFQTLHSRIYIPDSSRKSLPMPDGQQVQSIVSQLHDIVAQEINDRLKKTGANARSLPAALRILFGDTTPPEASGLTYYARPFSLGDIRGVAVGYEILAGEEAAAEPDNYPYFEFYNHEKGEWMLTAQAPTPSEFNGCTFAIHPVKSPTNTEVWYLVSGFKIGDTGTRLKLRLYSYDGATLRTVWQRNELTRGQVSVTNNVITLEYDRKYKSLDPDNRVQEEFQVVPFA